VNLQTFSTAHGQPVIRDSSRAELDAVRRLFASSNDAPYDLAAVAEEKCFERGVSGAASLRVAVQSEAIVGAAVTSASSIRILIVDRARRGHGIGSALLQDSERRLHEARVRHITVAAEGGNYFTPGVVSSDRATLEFFSRRGYRVRDTTSNLICPLPPKAAAAVDAGVRRATETDRQRVAAFIEKEFGRIWRFEAGRAFARAEPTLFFLELGGEIAGFAAHDANNRGLGWFGPTGVARRFRGQGFGRALLLASLADLHAHGFPRAIIPWTDAYDFYRKSCGAEIHHQFSILIK
jgi:mycothiol synthase